MAFWFPSIVVGSLKPWVAYFNPLGVEQTLTVRAYGAGPPRETTRTLAPYAHGRVDLKTLVGTGDVALDVTFSADVGSVTVGYSTTQSLLPQAGCRPGE